VSSPTITSDLTNETNTSDTTKLTDYSLIIHLGPNAPSMDGLKASGGDGLQDNPRCLRRDISNYASSTWLNNEAIVNAITQSPNISTFQRTISGRFEEGFLGIHSAGHFTIGGDADVRILSHSVYIIYEPQLTKFSLVRISSPHP
jgi:Common central domain of tyrosinase